MLALEKKKRSNSWQEKNIKLNVSMKFFFAKLEKKKLIKRKGKGKGIIRLGKINMLKVKR